jgi:hypothetical protein
MKALLIILTATLLTGCVALDYQRKGDTVLVDDDQVVVVVENPISHINGFIKKHIVKKPAATTPAE